MRETSSNGEQLCLDLTMDRDEQTHTVSCTQVRIVPFVSAKTSLARREALERVKRSGIFRSNYAGT